MEVGEMQEFFKKLLPTHELKASLSKDSLFIKELSDRIVQRLLDDGLIEDRLISMPEAMERLGIKTHFTLRNIKALKPIRRTKNAHPKYKLSDINRYISQLNK